MPTEKPDKITIDAWLSGDLSGEATAEVELLLDQSGGDRDEKAAFDFDLLRDLPDISGEPEVSSLIEEVKTRTKSSASPASAHSWREIVNACDDPDLLGTLGNYEIISQIAAAGMGVILKGRDPELDRIAAIKVLSPQLATNATARERFLREARAAAALEHENILPIYGVHDEGNAPFFAMRFASGGTLQDAFDRGENFDFERIKMIARGVAAALGAAHEKGIVHRDIKPANILFDADDPSRVWVCDFGIARSIDDPGLTYDGTISGTPRYMSPEQAAGQEVDGRSDLFSLGAVLYRCATGRDAFTGSTAAAVIRDLKERDDTPKEIKSPELPDWFGRLVANLLAKDPCDRPQSAAVVIRAIDSESSPRPKQSARRRKRVLTALGITALLTLTVSAALQVSPVRDVVNAILAKRHDQAFIVEGQIGAHESLADAINTAPHGGVILLPEGDPVLVDHVRIPAGKTLAFRPAAPGGRATFSTATAGAAGIRSKGNIRLERIDFELKGASGGKGILMIEGGTADLSDCGFSLFREASRFEDIKSRTVEISGGAELNLRDCRLKLTNGNAITVRDPRIGGGSPARIAIHDTEMEAFYGIALAQFALDEPGVEVVVSGLDFSGECFLKRSLGNATPRLDFQVTGSTFRPEHALAWFACRVPEVVRERFRWEGSGNIFPNGKGGVRVAMGPLEEHTREMIPLGDFSKAKSAESGLPSLVRNLVSGSKPFRRGGTWAEIKRTGEIYDSLEDVFPHLREEDTVYLSGTHRCRKELATSRIALVGAEHGDPATVIAGNTSTTAIRLEGTCLIQDIRFVREEVGPESPPLLKVDLKNAYAKMANCWFQVPSGENPVTGGLEITGPGKMHIYRAYFETPGIHIRATGETSRGTSLLLDGCTFLGGSAFSTSMSGSPFRIDAGQCAFLTGSVWRKLDDVSGPANFNLSQSFIDPLTALFFCPEMPKEEFKKHVRWSGVRNTYTDGMRAISASGTFEIDSLEAMGDALARYRENGPRHRPPADRSAIPEFPAPRDLRIAVGERVTGPVIEGLDNLQWMTARWKTESK